MMIKLVYIYQCIVIDNNSYLFVYFLCTSHQQGNVITSNKTTNSQQVFIESISWKSTLYGVFLILFGSQFPTTILVWETFLLVGYDKTIEAYNKIKEDMLVTIHNLKDFEAQSKDTIDKAMEAYRKRDLSGLSIEDGKHFMGVLRQLDYKHAAEAMKTLQITVMVRILL